MNKAAVLRELKAHFPYSIFFTAAGLVLAALLTYTALLVAPEAGDKTCAPGEHQTEQREEEVHEEHDGHEHCAHGQTRLEAASEMLFHIFHPIHLLLSAMATTAMFFKHEKRVIKAVIVGLAGSLGVCGFSDIFLPYLCGGLMNTAEMHFHWCVMEHPLMILPFSALGVAAGLMAAGTVHSSTIISHSAHTFISSTASLFYLISFGITEWYTGTTLSIVFLIVIAAVTIPCCVSDVLFPTLIARADGDDCSICGHSH